jgi:fatty acid desaturase
VLKRRVQAAGLLKKQPRYYAAVIAINVTALVACFVALAFLHNPWLLAIDAIVMGLVSGQLGFQLHDAGHFQMFETRWINRVVGFLTADALLGMSYGWWTSKHNRHHGNPNDVDEDPDINSMALAYSQAQAVARRGLFRKLAAYQAFFFFPLLFLLGFGMHAASVDYLARNGARRRRLELLTLAAHVVVYGAVLLFLLGPWAALMVMVVHKAVGGSTWPASSRPTTRGCPRPTPTPASTSSAPRS